MTAADGYATLRRDLVHNPTDHSDLVHTAPFRSVDSSHPASLHNEVVTERRFTEAIFHSGAFHSKALSCMNIFPHMVV